MYTFSFIFSASSVSNSIVLSGSSVETHPSLFATLFTANALPVALFFGGAVSGFGAGGSDSFGLDDGAGILGIFGTYPEPVLHGTIRR